MLKRSCINTMLITLCYVWLTLYKEYQDYKKKMHYLQLVRKYCCQTTIIFRSIQRAVSKKYDKLSPLLLECPAGWAENRIHQTSHKEVVSVCPQMKVSLHHWTAYLDKQEYLAAVTESTDPDKCFVLLEVQPPEDETSFLNTSMSVPLDHRVKVVDHATPLAWKSGTPFGIVLECSADDFGVLGQAFMDDQLVMDEMLELKQIMSVQLVGKARNLLRTSSGADTMPWSPLCLTPRNITPQSSSTALQEMGDTLVFDAAASLNEEPSFYHSGSNESLASDGDAHELCRVYDMVQPHRVHGLPNREPGDGQDEMYCESPQIDGTTIHVEEESKLEDSSAGEAPSDPVECLAPEVLTPVQKARGRKSSCGKPPNILVYCGKKDSARLFESVKNILAECINADRYTVYNLKHDQVMTTPWLDNTTALVISSDKVYDGVDRQFLKYFHQGGIVISFTSAFDNLFVDRVQMGSSGGVLMLTYKQWVGVNVICGRHFYTGLEETPDDVHLTVLGKDQATSKPVLLQAYHEASGGIAILSQVNLDKAAREMAISPEVFQLLKQFNQARFDILSDLLSNVGIDCSHSQPPQLTPAYLFPTPQDRGTVFLKALAPRLTDGMLRGRHLTLHFMESTADMKHNISATYLPVLTTGKHKSHLFDLQMYQACLQTRVLGNMVIYAEVLPSTMTVFDGLMFSVPEEIGLVAVASQQTGARGRGGNIWLSPEGCAVFSAHVRIPLLSRLGQYVSFLQHIASLAMVQAVTTTPGYEKLDLRVKWPNDIYVGSKIKIGGILVTSSVMHNTVHSNIGCGFNVTNESPTICINEVIEQYNQVNATNLLPFTVEKLIGRTLTRLEHLINLFNTEGREAFLAQYYDRWLHGGSLVRLESEDGPEAMVMGLDDYGYLLVRTLEGTVISVNSDGNSFDMMKNLITMKSR